MKKTVSAFVIAAFTLCAAPAFYATSAAAATAKPAATQTVKIKSSVKSSAKVSAKVRKAKAIKTSSRLSSGSARSPYWQCVTFARSLTGMQIFGDAWTWWDKANAKYNTGRAPQPGAVMVFPRQGKMNRGHVAVVSQIITDRYIQITHANWSPINGRRGQVEKDVNVMDVSAKGDWSKVKVWYGPLNDFGTTVYATNGFIYQDTAEGQAQAQKVIAESEGLPPEPQQYQQIAAADSTPTPELPADLKAALTPSNDRGFLNVRANTVAARVTGKDAAAIVARIGADKAPSDIAAVTPPNAGGAPAAKAPSRP
ncbi:CHAP domain-containing protein [Asticcacaulis sp. AC402]|uniref:CHAP domain-containing protein n=1 Tax=Asticcacaulis sp. AC402 TaxID=1282361 RepID=UPI0003C41102|nr:CHAP domain-containing protein [Asticcacaulis sp. AC402]ESQ73765.1 hypothetical protein ABAC402_17640 [Asticcacaulis sp. AC402]